MWKHFCQSNFTGHKSLLWDNECPVCFSHYVFGPFPGEPGHINFQDWLALMKASKKLSFRPNEFLTKGSFIYGPQYPGQCLPHAQASYFQTLPPECFCTSHLQFLLPLMFYAEWLFSFYLSLKTESRSMYCIAKRTLWLNWRRKTNWVLSSVNKVFSLCLTMRSIMVVLGPLSHSGVGFLPVWESGGVLTGQSLS